MSSDQARVAFERNVAELYEKPPKMTTKVVSTSELAVPGFTTLEAFIGSGGDSVRGWARADGTAVIARMVNFGPVLDALGFRDDAKSPSARAIAERLAWAHGSFYTLVDKVAKGEAGATKALHVAPERDPQDDGRVELRFALKKQDPELVIQYRVFANPDGEYDIDVHQLTPR